MNIIALLSVLRSNNLQGISQDVERAVCIIVYVIPCRFTCSLFGHPLICFFNMFNIKCAFICAHVRAAYMDVSREGGRECMHLYVHMYVQHTCKCLVKEEESACIYMCTCTYSIHVRVS